MMTSLALPVRSDLRVDLYPRVTAIVSVCALRSSVALTFSRLDDQRQLGVDAVGIFLRFLWGHLECLREATLVEMG